MAIYSGSGYEICNLEKYKCHICNKAFIVGTELLDGKKPCCPYCASIEVEKTAWTDDDDLRAFNVMGCLSLLKVSNSDDIENLELTVRTYNVLKRAGYKTITELGHTSDTVLLAIPRFNTKCLEEVRSKIKEYGRDNMACRFASRTDEYHGWKCSESDGACVFFVPNEQRCYDEYGEGPLAFKEDKKEAQNDENQRNRS